ncbi:hypothetical protein RM697_07155 [Ichthyenterobacterium sp. W332]|uniref:Uncharacterized protein n=1 Tax=Microcosmobacter mediterraneus TaxID=3075607 RepID=A0ABU2YK48_9FLAO|nr:hypothetical protein [Ichthyenterobacterium sp. W332]MDT0558417.1 hypothetical protein [Ichthyenterobacterium sp. W332]
MKLIKYLGHATIITLLTVLTQVGGLVWLLALILSYKLKRKKRYLFPLLYLVFNLVLIPPMAKTFGREQLPIFHKTLEPINWFYPLTFRNYVTPELKALLIEASKSSQLNAYKIIYLDANFPFIDGFPLLPHRSHNDGKKIDIAFLYNIENGTITNNKPSNSGYGIFVNSDQRISRTCKELGYWHYDITKYLTFGSTKNLKFNQKGTAQLIKELLSHSETDKIFIEPYLKNNLVLNKYSKIRFHGCQAVRHDDHIHLQIK